MAKVVILGAGPMGLAAAHELLLRGHDVDLVEASSEPGGMAGHFDFGGLSIERFYHFVCRADTPTFELMRELGIAHKLHWKLTSMGFFYGGQLHDWGNPLALFRIPGIPLITKLRYGLFFAWCTHKKNWPELEHSSAKRWITKWLGVSGYEIFWKTLLEYKFYEYADTISAAWLWTRIKRVASSRKSVMQEELGFIEGGSKTLIDALVRSIESKGGRIHLSCPAERVCVTGQQTTGVIAGGNYFRADYVISTIPIVHVPGIIPELPADLTQQYRRMRNIGICCVILKLRRSVSEHFWINIGQTKREIPGIVEFSNLRHVGEVIVYVPYYMPSTNKKMSWKNEDFVEDAFGCLHELNPDLVRADLMDFRVARLSDAQPICDVGFGLRLPPVQTPIAGLQIADTGFYYPEDRGIAESVRLGRSMARAVPTESRLDGRSAEEAAVTCCDSRVDVSDPQSARDAE